MTVEDLRADGSYAPATFDGTRQDSSGASTSPPGSPIVAQTQVVLRAGTGTVDPAAGTASLSWRGSFSVLYYSGMTFFVVSDPTLHVTPGSAKLTATVSGYATSMDDQSKWDRLPPAKVTLADFASIDLTGTQGFSATPRYLGVRYAAPSGGTAQVRSGSSWGSFPASLVGFLNKVGMASYWYSSDGATDAKKVAAPVTVSWDATAPVTAPTRTPPSGPSAQPSVPFAPAPPTTRPAPTVTRTTVIGRPATARPAAATIAPPAVATPPPVGTAMAAERVPELTERMPVSTLYAAPAAARARQSADSRAWEWALGGVLLAAGLVLLAAPHLRRKAPR